MKKAQSHRVQPALRALGAAGFTVLELMITVAVLAILLGVGVPSFQRIMRQNRLAGQTNELLAAAAMARSEAVKRGTTVTLCPANPADPMSCSANDVWGNGWLVFADDQGAVGTIDIDGTLPDDVIIQRWSAAAAGSITIENDDVESITYRGDGGTTLAVGARTTFTLAPEAKYCADLGAREVTVTATGRVNATRVDCP